MASVLVTGGAGVPVVKKARSRSPAPAPISCYAPMARVALHSHKVQEQVYHVLEGATGFTRLTERR
jgi:quercetin dioxygenase-like cupin family protein